MATLEGSTARILAALVHAHSERGLRLGELAKAVGLSHPTVLTHLRNLARDGWVEAVPNRTASTGPNVEHLSGTRYRALPTTSIERVDPTHGILERWTTTTPMDWRFPLVGRVPDAGAQAFLYEWLDRATARGLLPAYRSRFEPKPRRAPLVSILVYGSCARGDAGPKSDLDILVRQETKWSGVSRLLNLAHEVALNHPRPVDVQAVTRDARLPPAFLARLRTEAKTVWCNDANAIPIEDPLELHHAV